jgi:hypothetical protein
MCIRIDSFSGGTRIDEACEALSAIADRLRKPVSTSFNGRELKAYPGWNCDDVWEYHDFLKWRRVNGKNNQDRQGAAELLGEGEGMRKGEQDNDRE